MAQIPIRTAIDDDTVSITMEAMVSFSIPLDKVDKLIEMLEPLAGVDAGRKLINLKACRPKFSPTIKITPWVMKRLMNSLKETISE